MTDQPQSLMTSDVLFAVAISGALAGAIASFIFSIIQWWWSQFVERKRIKLILYAELVELVGRCWYDFRAPWFGYLIGQGPERQTFNVVKFKPHEPILFNSLADRLNILTYDQISNLLRFHTALTHLRNDINLLDPDIPDRDFYSLQSLSIIARRFAMTLEPGRHAILCLRSDVPEADELESKFIASQDRESEGTYLEELEEQISKASQVLTQQEEEFESQ